MEYISFGELSQSKMDLISQFFLLFQMFSEGQNFNGHPDSMHPFVNNNDIISKFYFIPFNLSVFVCVYACLFL